MTPETQYEREIDRLMKARGLKPKIKLRTMSSASKHVDHADDLEVWTQRNKKGGVRGIVVDCTKCGEMVAVLYPFESFAAAPTFPEYASPKWSSVALQKRKRKVRP